MSTLSQIPDDLEDVDHLAWALGVIASTDIVPTKRLSDFVLKMLIDSADFAGMDKLLDARREWHRKYGEGPNGEEAEPQEAFEYVLACLQPGGRAYAALSASLPHFILTANFPAIEAVFDECVREYREVQTEADAQAEYEQACLTVTCWHCGARPGAQCVTRSGAPTATHAARGREALRSTGGAA